MSCYLVRIIWDCRMGRCLRRNSMRRNLKFNMSRMDSFRGKTRSPLKPHLCLWGLFVSTNCSPPYALQLVGIPPAGAKSRVETQIKLDLQLLHHASHDFVKDTYEFLKLPSYGVSKEKFRLPNLKGPHPFP